ncbi:hypothetical protein LIER_04071 [Lithospermum erythrorhizon]|uniref:Zinc finger Mcm10/DnaG-type domain-containing protein n=1 Tax=Lithospermum erythrorhizon TaxID=34254 RepID=A0AAV3NVU2_LITER
MSNSNDKDDLDLLLSLQDRVVETPPHSPGYLSDDGSPRRKRKADMSVFREAVEDCLDYDTKAAQKAVKSNAKKTSNDSEVEKFSGLRIRNQLVSPTELSDRIADIRFVRLPAIKNLLRGDTLSGCWATTGVLTEKGAPRTSSTGKAYAIWKMGCLDENFISVFLFGDAYQRNCEEKLGTVFTLFNCSVRKDNSETGFSLSVFSAAHILRLGVSADYGVCKGKRKDGIACTLAINKQRGIYCSFHRQTYKTYAFDALLQKASDKYSMTRSELRGGNLKTAFRTGFKREGIHCINPLGDRTNFKKSNAPLKILSVEGLKKALSNASRVTTNTYSQGIRFLTEITGKGDLEAMKKSTAPNHSLNNLGKRFSSSQGRQNQDSSAKRTKQEHKEAPQAKENQTVGKMIELDIISSDDEL